MLKDKLLWTILTLQEQLPHQQKTASRPQRLQEPAWRLQWALVSRLGLGWKMREVFVFNPDSRFLQPGWMPMLAEGKYGRWWLGGGGQPDLGGLQAGVMKSPVGASLASCFSGPLCRELSLTLIFPSPFDSAPGDLNFCSKEKLRTGNRAPKTHGTKIFRKKTQNFKTISSP